MLKSNSEAYDQFIANLCDGNDSEIEVMLNNRIINQCIQLGFRSGMTEVETLRVAILAIIKISDEATESKIKEFMMRAHPSNLIVKDKKC